MAAGAWAGACLAEWFSWQVWSGLAPRGLGLVAALVLAFALVWALAARARGLRSAVVLLAAGIAVGCATSGLQALAWHRQSADVIDSGARTWAGVVEHDPVSGAYGTSVRVALTGGPLAGAHVRVRWPPEAAVPELGRTVRFSAVLTPLPADERWARRAARTGVCATGSAWKAEIGPWRAGPVGWLHRWRSERAAWLGGVSGPGGDLLTGILLGDRRRLAGTEVEADFEVLGLTHLVAVSGGHLVVVCGAVAALAYALGLRRRSRILATMVAGAAYAVATGLAYSAIRALAMLLAGGLVMIAGRRDDSIASLAVAVIVVIAVLPWSVFDAGFRLSVLAVAGLVIFGSLAAEWASAAMPRALSVVGQVVALTCVAQLATMPLVASLFGMVSVMAPVANVYAAPMVSLALCIGLAAAIVEGVIPALGLLMAQIAAAVLTAAAWFSAWLADLPGAAVVVGSSGALVSSIVIAAVVLWLVWPRPRTAAHARLVASGALLCMVALSLGPPPSRRAEVIVMDVGQADAILVRDGGRNMLVDAAADPAVLRQALARHGVRHLDVVVLTHAHDDHTGGAAGLSGVCTVGWVGTPSSGPPSVGEDARWIGPETEVRGLSAGASWEVGSTAVRVLWPPGDPPAELDINDTSVVLHLRTGSFDGVLTGDIEEAAQRGMAEEGTLVPIEMLKVPHHGSRNGLTGEALDAWDPEVALISVGADNRFGHPSPETIELLRAAGVRTFRTDVYGDLIVEVGRSGYRVRVPRRGEATAVRARMLGVSDAMCVTGETHRRITVVDARGRCGDQGSQGSKACVPDLRLRGVAPGKRAPPSA